MTTEQKSGERKITAFLGNPDRPDIGNAIHSTDGAKEYGYQAALVGGRRSGVGRLPPSSTHWGRAGWITAGWRSRSAGRPIPATN